MRELGGWKRAAARYQKSAKFLKTIFEMEMRSMSRKAFKRVVRGLEEAKEYMEGAREGYRVIVPPSMHVKGIRRRLHRRRRRFLTAPLSVWTR